MRVVAYTRVSTERQAEHGLGLEVQRHALRRWARESGDSIRTWISDDGVSGAEGLDVRRGLLEAFTLLQDREVDGIVVYRLDRLARDLVLQEQLLAEIWRLGGRAFSVSPTEDAYLDPAGAEADPSRALVRRILGAVADYERSLIRLRLAAGKARKADHGGYIGGGVPYGYRADGRELEPDDAEQATLSRMRKLSESGLSTRRVGAVLDAEGLAPRSGGPWESSAIAKILRRLPRSSGAHRAPSLRS